MKQWYYNSHKCLFTEQAVFCVHMDLSTSYKNSGSHGVCSVWAENSLIGSLG